MVKLIAGVCCALGIASAGPVFAATFCVNDTATLQAALDIADNNGQSDTMQLQQGTYTGHFVYNANIAETGNITILGGYTPACSDRVLDPTNTVLSGNDGVTGRTLLVSGRSNSDFMLEGVTVRDGRDSTGGSGLDVDRMIRVTISDNIFTENAAVAGSDAVGGVNIDRTQSAQIHRNLFIANHGGKNGALSISDLQLTEIDANSIIGNTSEQDGGGIDGDTNGTIIITNNVIAGNSSSEDGAGINIKLFANGTSGFLDATNNTITGNIAGQEGGGVDLKMIGDTTGAAFYNNIVYANSAGVLGRDFHIDNDDEENGIASPVLLSSNDFDQSFLGFFSVLPIAIDASNLNNVDPLFANVAADDFHLQPLSPVIDAGNSSAPNLTAADRDGLSRVSGIDADMGAFESQAADSDADGVPDSNDNCTLVANGDQRDTNNDGFGNVCDPDLNNDGDVNFLDLGLMKAVFFSADPDADLDGDGAVNFSDLAIMKALFFGPPGPSGVAP